MCEYIYIYFKSSCAQPKTEAFGTRLYIFKSSFAQPQTEAFGISFIPHRIYTLKGGGSFLFLKSLVFDRSMSRQLDENHYIYVFTDI